MLRFVEKHVHGHQFHISMNNIIDKKELERRTNKYNRDHFLLFILSCMTKQESDKHIFQVPTTCVSRPTMRWNQCMLRFVEKHVHGHQFHISMNNIIDEKELERRTNKYNRDHFLLFILSCMTKQQSDKHHKGPLSSLYSLVHDKTTK